MKRLVSLIMIGMILAAALGCGQRELEQKHWATAELGAKLDALHERPTLTTARWDPTTTATVADLYAVVTATTLKAGKPLTAININVDQFAVNFAPDAQYSIDQILGDESNIRFLQMCWYDELYRYDLQARPITFSGLTDEETLMVINSGTGGRRIPVEPVPSPALTGELRDLFPLPPAPPSQEATPKPAPYQLPPRKPSELLLTLSKTRYNDQENVYLNTTEFDFLKPFDYAYQGRAYQLTPLIEINVTSGSPEEMQVHNSYLLARAQDGATTPTMIMVGTGRRYDPSGTQIGDTDTTSAWGLRRGHGDNIITKD